MDKITRRGALSAAVAAGLTGAFQPNPRPAAAKTVPASPSKTIMLAPMLNKVVYAEDLAAESRRLLARAEEGHSAAMVLHDQLVATLSPDQHRLFNQYADAMTGADTDVEEFRVAEIARHLPGLAPMIRMIWNHTLGTVGRAGKCCTPGQGFEA